MKRITISLAMIGLILFNPLIASAANCIDAYNTTVSQAADVYLSETANCNGFTLNQEQCQEEVNRNWNHALDQANIAMDNCCCANGYWCCVPHPQ